jgi:hypothetical protein
MNRLTADNDFLLTCSELQQQPFMVCTPTGALTSPFVLRTFVAETFSQ